MLVTRAIYKQYKKAQAKSVGVSFDVRIPDNWQEFCSGIWMRSGGEMRQFTPYKYQILLANLINKYSNITVVKTRQLGTTQMLIALFLYEAVKNPAYSASAFMRNEDDAVSINSRIRRLVEQAEIPLATEESKLIRLANGAEIRTHNSSKEGNRSADSVCALLFDEAAFQRNIKSIYAASTASTILTGNKAKIITVSTPSAKSGWYWDLLTENNGDRDVETICKEVGERKLYSDDLPGFYWFEDELGGCKVFIHWRCHPIYGQWDDFVERMAAKYKLDEADAQREFNLVFYDSAIEVFSAESILDAENSALLLNPSILSCYVGLYISEQYSSAVALVDNIVVKSVCEKNPSANTAINLVSFVADGMHIKSIVLKRYDGGEEIAKRLRLAHTSTRVLDIPKSQLPNTIASLSLLLDGRNISIPKYKNPIRDTPIAKHLRDFRRQDNKLGSLQKDKRDDCAWALAFAVMASEYSVRQLPMGSS
jgi:hypothetical protein